MNGVTALPRKAAKGLIGAVAALLMTTGVAGAQDLGPAGTTGATAEIVAAAKKEGVLTFYGTAQQDAYDAIFKEFMKDYPQIKVTATRVRTANFLERVLLEYKSGDNKADVVHASSEVADLEEAGAILNYTGVDKAQAERYRFPAPKTMPGMVTDALLVKFVDYNTNMIKPADLPKSWDDLLDPKWKGKLALDIEGYEWFAAMWKFMGPEKADKFMKGLAPNVVLREGATSIMELMVAGEFPISLEAYGHRIVDFQKQGAPVDIVKPPFQPVVVIPSYWGAIKTAKNPNAAKLALHWLASDRGQAAQAAAGRVPVLKTGNHQVLKWLDEYKPETFVVEPKSIDYTAVAKQFNTYFVRSKN